MRRLAFCISVTVSAAIAPVPSFAILEPCKTTVHDGYYRVKCDQVCENVATCVADGDRVCNGTCIGGPNNGLACDSDTQCPDVSNVCVGGVNDGLPCTNGNQCPDLVEYRCGCDPGSNPLCGQLCEEDVECQYEHFTCGGGPNEDQLCVSDADCAGHNCRRDPDSDPGCDRIVLEDGRCGVNAECGPRASGDPILCSIGVAHVKGSGGNDIVFVGDGDVKVEGRGGNDQILKGANNIIRYNNGPALNPANTGRLLADGGNGDDTIGNASASDGDVLFGGSGDDFLIGCGGRNVLHGEDGDDQLWGWAFCPIADGPLGSIYCGGDGDDTINGWGTGHQCMDAGPDQTVRTTGSDCSYLHVVNGGVAPDAADVATAANCTTPSPAGLAAEPCSCDFKFSDVVFPIE
jgi:hypothetical protein